jgi:hypothetical protein
MNTVLIEKSEVSEIIGKIPKSAIFTVFFTKVNGEERMMNCRRGVKSHLTPNPTRQKPAMDDKYITVFDMQKKAYRHVNKDTTTKIHAARTEYVVREA